MLTRLRLRQVLASGCLLLGSLPLAGTALAQVTGPTIGGERHAAKPEIVAAGWLERRWARGDLERLAAAVDARIRDRGPLPADAGLAFLAPDYLPARQALDPWGTAYRLRGGRDAAVLSAGPDGKFGTADDLSQALAGSWPATAPIRVDTDEPSAATRDTEPRETAPQVQTRSPPEAESAQARSTRQRMTQIAEALRAFRAREGHFPEHDDAARLLALLGLDGSAEDGWGRRLSYLSLAAGSRCVLASRGEDGRFGRSLEEYLRGAAPAGDLVILNARD